MVNNQIWPGWEIIEKIGSGGFGEVYKIRKEDENGDFFSALKVVNIPQSSDEISAYRADGYDDDSITKIFRSQVDDLVKEFKMMATFRGTANIVSYEDHMVVPKDGEAGWTVLIRMELLTTLTNRYNECPLDERETVRVGKDICAALALCEKLNIVHRDIKPQNIFVNAFGDYKLGDFGVAKAMDHTTHATKIGTCSYMAPEVYRGDAYNASADIYSVGLLMYWLLNERRLPFLPLPPEVPTAAMMSESYSKRFAGTPLPPPKNGCKELKDVVLKACAFNPADRFKNAAEMGEALIAASAFIGVGANKTEVIDGPTMMLFGEDKTSLLDQQPRDEKEQAGVVLPEKKQEAEPPAAPEKPLKPAFIPAPPKPIEKPEFKPSAVNNSMLEQIRITASKAFKSGMSSLIMAWFPVFSILAMIFGTRAVNLSENNAEIARRYKLRIGGKNKTAKVLGRIGKVFAIIFTVIWAIIFLIICIVASS